MKKNKDIKQKTIEEKKKDLFTSFIMELALVTLALTYFLLLFFSFYDHPANMVSAKDQWSNAFSEFSNALSSWQLLRFLGKGYFPNKSGGMIVGVVAVVDLFIFMQYTFNKLRIHHDENTAKGSAQWANLPLLRQRYAEFADKKKRDFRNAKNNVIFGRNFFASIDPKKHKRALNTLVLGTTGCGKTRFWLKPNLMQMNSSYVITDPKGEILADCGEALRRNGYEVKVFDIKEKKECSTYNPLQYCKREDDIKKIVEAFIKNTDKTGGKGGGSKDPFWDDAMNGFMCSTIAFLTTKPKGDDRPYAQIPEVTGGTCYAPCFSNLCEFTRMANSKWTPDCGIELFTGATLGDGKNNTANASKMAAMFANLAAYEAKLQNKPIDMIEKPYALREWENFKIAPEKTSTTILMTVAVRLDPFNIEEIRKLTTNDTLELDDFAKRKTALFLVMDASDKTYNFLLAFLYTQLFNILYNFGEYKIEGSKNLRLKDGELVRYFSKEECANKDAMDKMISDIKKAKPKKMEKPGNHPKTVPDGKGHFTLSDEWYDIVSPNGVLVTRRPTKAEADAYCEQLRHAQLKSGRVPALPIPVRMLIDEFPNIGQIPEYKEKLATMRGYDISSTTICQTITQLKGMYPDDYEVIDANSPFVVFLGGDENSNNEYLSKKLGMSTIRNNNNSVDNKKVNMSYNIDGRELMRPEELGRMPFEQELIFIYGEQPIRDEKFKLEEHKNYKQFRDFADDCGLKDEFYNFDRADFIPDEAPRTQWKRIKATMGPRCFQLTNETFCEIFGAPTVEEATNRMANLNSISIENSVPKAY